MSVSASELNSMAAGLTRTYSRPVILLASLLLVGRSVLTHLGRQQGSNTEPLLSTLDGCVSCYADTHGIAETDIQQAVVDLTQAGSTINYLHSVPD